MIRFTSTTASLLAAAMVLTTSSAQTAAKPKILTSPPPGQLAWTVSYSYERSRESIASEKSEDLASKALEAGDLARPEKTEFIIKSPVSMRTTRFEDGGKEEGYQYQNQEYQVSRQNKEVMMFNLASYPSVDQLFRKTFPGVHWVTPKLFVKVEKAYGQDCAYFRENAAPPPSSDVMDSVLDASKYVDREAWFSIATGLPVAFKAGDATGKFTFEPAANAEVKIPADVRAKIGEYAKYQAYLKQRAGNQTVSKDH